MMKFVKRDPRGNPVVVTEYAVTDESTDEVLLSLRRFDFLAIRLGYDWESVPAESQIVAAPEHPPEKVWDSPVMNGESTVGGVSDATYVRRMGNAGIDAEEALKLRRFIESIL